MISENPEFWNIFKYKQPCLYHKTYQCVTLKTASTFQQANPTYKHHKFSLFCEPLLFHGSLTWGFINIIWGQSKLFTNIEYTRLYVWVKKVSGKVLYSHMHNNTTKKKDERRHLYNYMYLSLYCQGSKRITQGLRVRGSWRPNITAIFWPPLLWPSALCLSRFPGMLNRRPRGPLCWVMALFTASYQHLLRTSTHQGPKAPRPDVAFPTTSRL